MTKRYLALLVALALSLALASCGKQASTSLPESLPPVESSSSSSPPSSSEPPAYPRSDAAAINPLTGLPRPEGLAADARPVAVMVANNQAALPQRGLAAADVLYEMVTEGGITRLMAMYGDYRTVPHVGPVRSARDSFLQFALPLNAIPVHIGSSIYGTNLLNLLAYKDVNGLYLGSTAFWFDAARNQPGAKPIEYCWFTDAALIWAGLERIDIPVGGASSSNFLFAEGAPAPGTDAYGITLTFSGASSAGFAYNEATTLYEKSIFGAPHIDEDGTILAFTNVIALNARINTKPDGRSAEFDFTEGTGIYFSGGKATPLSWSKGGPESPLNLYAADGAPLPIHPGKSYIAVLPSADEAPPIYTPKQ